MDNERPNRGRLKIGLFMVLFTGKKIEPWLFIVFVQARNLKVQKTVEEK